MTYPDDAVEKALKVFYDVRGSEEDAMRAALAAAEAAMWRPIDEAAKVDGAQYFAELEWYPPGLQGNEKYRESSLDIIRWTNFNDGGWVRYSNGQPTRFRPLPTPPAASPGRE